MIARPFPLGFRGFDTTTTLDGPLCKAARAAGFDFALRYGRSVTPGEVDAAMGEGLWLGFLTYGRQADFSDATGIADAQVLLDHVHGVLAVPGGVTLGLDLETPKGATYAELQAYEGGYAHTVVAGGGHALEAPDSSGLYVGAGLMMTSRQLYELASTRYYKSGSRIVDAAGNAAEPECGWTLIQGFPLDQPFATTRIDFDFAHHDFRGRQWWGVAPE